MTTRTVGFDLDQTLVDSTERIVESFRSAFRTMRIADVQPTAFTPWFGYPLEEILQRVAPGTDPAEFVPLYRRAYDEERPGEAGPMPGARDALEWLRDNGFRTVVVSAKHHPVVDVALVDAGLRELVDAYYGDHFGEQKAIPLREEDAAFYVGDHVADMHAASLAGVLGIAVVSGAHDTRALREAGAASVIPSLAALPATIERLLD
ncbi:HAD family hydrolase [Arsenicicoccus bolidensis]|uniref:HAD family hydrolase n=1 Tax=Arsenicicoccus bolidensis TaxID=229480 RepID=UPI00040FBA81|nr:HAD family hydrolase [Arsenicicoccus bolidensis]